VDSSGRGWATDALKHGGVERTLMITNLAAAVQAFTSNVFHVAGERPVVVDPGANFDVVQRLEDHPDPEAVVLTHTHRDHVGNLEDVKAAFGIDAWGFDDAEDGVDHAIDDGDVLRLGDHDYEALHTPGHHPGHLCFHAAEPGVLFAGDLVFQNGGFGRTDLEGADHAALVESIDRLLERLDDDLRAMHVGHGPSVENEPYAHIELAGSAARSAGRR
jgi:hydroxyacylglutathione hydrolase